MIGDQFELDVSDNIFGLELTAVAVNNSRCPWEIASSDVVFLLLSGCSYP